MLNPANYSRWVRKPIWYLNEAVALILGIDPGQTISSYTDRGIYDEFRDMLDTAIRSEGESLEVLSRTS